MVRIRNARSDWAIEKAQFCANYKEVIKSVIFCDLLRGKAFYCPQCLLHTVILTPQPPQRLLHMSALQKKLNAHPIKRALAQNVCNFMRHSFQIMHMFVL